MRVIHPLQPSRDRPIVQVFPYYSPPAEFTRDNFSHGGRWFQIRVSARKSERSLFFTSSIMRVIHPLQPSRDRPIVQVFPYYSPPAEFTRDNFSHGGRWFRIRVSARKSERSMFYVFLPCLLFFFSMFFFDYVVFFDTW